jgi:hypothetical protein
MRTHSPGSNLWSQQTNTPLSLTFLITPSKRLDVHWILAVKSLSVLGCLRLSFLINNSSRQKKFCLIYFITLSQKVFNSTSCGNECERGVLERKPLDCLPCQNRGANKAPTDQPLTTNEVSCRKAYGDCTASLALEQEIAYTKNHHSLANFIKFSFAVVKSISWGIQSGT